jgi:hypothetical protein
LLEKVALKLELKRGGLRRSYSSTVLTDTGARMGLIDKSLTERVGVQYTGRTIDFISVSSHIVRALEVIVSEIEVENST